MPGRSVARAQQQRSHSSLRGMLLLHTLNASRIMDAAAVVVIGGGGGSGGGCGGVVVVFHLSPVTSHLAHTNRYTP